MMEAIKHAPFPWAIGVLNPDAVITRWRAACRAAEDLAIALWDTPHEAAAEAVAEILSSVDAALFPGDAPQIIRTAGLRVEGSSSEKLQAAGAALQRLHRRAQQLMSAIDGVAGDAPCLGAMEQRRDFCLMSVEGRAAAMAGIPGQSLADLRVKVDAMVASNDGALKEDGHPSQTAPEALCWSIARDIRAMWP